MTSLKLTLVQRIGMTIALLVGVFLVVGAFTAWSVKGIQAQTHQTVDTDLAQLVRMAAVQENLLKLRRAEKDISIDLLMKMERVPQRIAEWKQHGEAVTAQLLAAIEAERDPALAQMLLEGRARQDTYIAQVGRTMPGSSGTKSSIRRPSKRRSSSPCCLPWRPKPGSARRSSRTAG